MGRQKMGLLQEMTFLPVVGVIKTLHFIEHTAMELNEKPANTVEDGKESLCNRDNLSCTITDVTGMDLTEIDDKIERETVFDDMIKIQSLTSYHNQENSLRSSALDSEGNSRRSSYNSQKSSRRPSQYSLDDTNEKDLDEQLLLKADFFAKAFPRRSLPSYVSDRLSYNIHRQRRSTGGF